jgi:hypothetical protein
MSILSSIGSRRRSSGAMYCMVPVRLPGLRNAGVLGMASPKSMILARSLRSTSAFLGPKSWWMNPAAWMAASPSAVWINNSSLSAKSSGFDCRTNWRLTPSMNSMTTNCAPLGVSPHS